MDVHNSASRGPCETSGHGSARARARARPSRGSAPNSRRIGHFWPPRLGALLCVRARAPEGGGEARDRATSRKWWPLSVVSGPALVGSRRFRAKSDRIRAQIGRFRAKLGRFRGRISPTSGQVRVDVGPNLKDVRPDLAYSNQFGRTLSNFGRNRRSWPASAKVGRAPPKFGRSHAAGVQYLTVRGIAHLASQGSNLAANWFHRCPFFWLTCAFVKQALGPPLRCGVGLWRPSCATDFSSAPLRNNIGQLSALR